MTKHTVLLADGDTMAFKAALAKTDHGDVRTFDEAIASIDSHYVWLRDYLKADEVTVLLSDPTENFRKGVFPAYKTNREGSERPPLIDNLKNYLREKYGAWHEPTLEADDLQGILATTPADEDLRRIVVSIDKDLRQIPGELFNPLKWDAGVQTITAEEGLLWMWTQTLTGDAVDGYPGVPLVGPKKAEKILTEALQRGIKVEDLWPTVLAVFEKNSLSKEYALGQLRCARILQVAEYDLIEQVHTLFVPPLFP